MKRIKNLFESALWLQRGLGYLIIAAVVGAAVIIPLAIGKIFDVEIDLL